MDPRFSELFRAQPNTHQDGCPVYISVGTLFRDNYSGRVMAQIVLGNLSIRSVCACTVEIRTFAVNGQPLETVSYQYLDLRAAPGSLFGGAVSIALPNPNTRRIHILLREVVLEPFQVWHSTDDLVQFLPQPARLESLLQNQRYIQYYSSLVGKPCMFIPRREQGLFLCTCGQMGMASDGPCRRCGSTFEALTEALDVDGIQAAVHEQLRQEEEARIAAAQAAEAERLAREKEEAERLAALKAKKKKTRKRVLTVVAILVILAALAGLTVGVIIPGVQNSNAYNAAAALRDEGSYTQAEEAFLALGDYKDAGTQALECRYLLAQSHLDKGEFVAAVEIWSSLADYSDSPQRLEEALNRRHEQDYQAAVKLMEEGAFMDAAAAFAKLGDFRDAQQMRTACMEMQKEADYTAAMEAAAAGDYLTAMILLEDLGNYEDAAFQYASAAYMHASVLFDNGEFQDAARYFTEAGDLEDAPQRRQESSYQYACTLLAEGKYSSAIVEFNGCGGYADSTRKLLEAKFGYVNENLDPENETTYAYLQELIAANYYGAQKVYNDLYAWKVTIVAYNSNPYDSTTNQSSLSKYQYMCVHFEVSGGEPGGSENIRTVITLPNGYTGTVHHPGSTAGMTLCTYGWYDNPSYGAAGTLYFYAYDEAGRLLASGSVRVTN